MRVRDALFGWVALVATLLLWAGASAAAPVRPEERVDRVDPVPAQLAAVDVEERLGKYVPKDLTFRDESGKTVLLGDLFDGRTPVILTLNYSNCPMLCSLQLNGLIQGLKQVEWGMNREYRIVTVSLEPNEPQDVAQRTLNRYLTQYGRPEARGGWRFLAGSEANVRAFADAIGFSYRYDERSQEYAHPAALALAAPDGKLVRYLYGLEYDPKTLRLGLVEASQGRIGTTLDRLILYCFHYDSSVGRYAPVARKIMQVGGFVAVVLLAGFVSVLLRAEAKRRRRLAQGTTP
ncbi:MAG TPA: SCO family protein [Polyangiaceae bacterium]|nr:SCO family protein [Polyangiaceae bacterium]